MEQHHEKLHEHSRKNPPTFHLFYCYRSDVCVFNFSFHFRNRLTAATVSEMDAEVLERAVATKHSRLEGLDKEIAFVNALTEVRMFGID